jgi:hypothetical protein
MITQWSRAEPEVNRKITCLRLYAHALCIRKYINRHSQTSSPSPDDGKRSMRTSTPVLSASACPIGGQVRSVHFQGRPADYVEAKGHCYGSRIALIGAEVGEGGAKPPIFDSKHAKVCFTYKVSSYRPALSFLNTGVKTASLSIQLL